jgi:phenylpropionate dioxygenase-like ring-hydroxylating dioxygenase large terminal subunit
MDQSHVSRIREGMKNEAARTEPPPGFPVLPDLPGGRYTDPEFLKLEQKYLWKKTWVYALHSDEVPEPGSYMQWDRLGEPLFFIRGEDDRIRCFYNTCRHRGAPVVTEAQGKESFLVCNYHGWTYDLKGGLVNLRDKRDFVGLDMSCRSLVEVRCENLGNWWFINLDDKAEPLHDYLGPIREQFLDTQPGKLRFVHKQAFETKCNVKVLLDAFLEVYHLKSIHQKTVDRFLDHRGNYISLWGRGHSRMVTPNRKPEWSDPGVKGLPIVDTVDPVALETAFSINLYPNLVTPVARAGLPFLLFWPLGTDRTLIEVHWFGVEWGDGPRPEVWDTRLRNFVSILDEDLQFCDAIQRSVQSSGFRGIPLNYQERRIYHWHEELDRRIGADKIDPALRVEPRLAAYIENER